MKEMKGFEQLQAYTTFQRSECTDKGLQPIGLRWVDVTQKGDVRRRLVAQEFQERQGGGGTLLFNTIAFVQSVVRQRACITRRWTSGWYTLNMF